MRSNFIARVPSLPRDLHVPLQRHHVESELVSYLEVCWQALPAQLEAEGEQKEHILVDYPSLRTTSSTIENNTGRTWPQNYT